VRNQAGFFRKSPARAGVSANDIIVVVGRVLFSFLFVMAALGHFSHQAVAYAASQGVPLASVAVPFSGVLALAGGLSIMLGYRARLGAWLLFLFLVPVTLLRTSSGLSGTP
jgi:putative oxidoreductase